MSPKSELEEFKTAINLVEFAAANGYHSLDTQKSSRACTVLRGNYGKIGVSRDSDAHWIFYKFDDKKGGSIIDLVKLDQSCNLGEARKILRPWINRDSNIVLDQYKKPQRSSPDRRKVAHEYARAKPVVNVHLFLQKRKIQDHIYLSKRFEGSVFIDQNNNAVFPHQDTKGICGLEKRNEQFYSFSKYGKRGLWFSRSAPGDNKFVFCESALDALAYYQFKDDGFNRYFSLGGQLSDEQIALIGVVIKSNPDKKLVLAFDNDSQGLSYIDKLRIEYPEKQFLEDIPPDNGKDWNDYL